MPKPATESNARLPWHRKLLFGVITTVGFWIVAEAALAVTGYQPTTATTDPLLGFSRQIPLLESFQSDDGTEMMRTASSKLVWFNEQSFTAAKPKGTKRIVCVGGSTTYGRPFRDETSYCGWLRELLRMADPDTHWEVINAGGVSYASYRVAEVMEEFARYEPDIFLVYSVHNEFLERRTYEGLFDSSALTRTASAILQKTRVGSLAHQIMSGRSMATGKEEMLATEVDEMLNHTVGPKDYHRDDAWQTKVARHYEWNLQRMVSIAKRSGAKIAFISPASNLRDCWPFKSETDSPSNDSVGNESSELVAPFKAIDRAKTVAQTEALVRVDPRNAEAHFELGRALFESKRFDEAETAFQRAIDEDVCPLRATTRIAETVQRVARQHRLPLIDFETKLQNHSEKNLGHRCLGREYFLDHVHPTIEVHGKLAWWILEELQRDGTIGGTLPTQTQRDLVHRKILGLVDESTKGIAFRNLAKVMHWAGKFPEAAEHAADALKWIPGDQESQFLLAECQLQQGQREEALRLYDELFDTGQYPRAWVNYSELLTEANRLGEAKSYLLLAMLDENHRQHDRALYLLSIVHLSLGEYKFALESLDGLDVSYQNDPDVLSLKAEAIAGIRHQPTNAGMKQ